MSKRHFLKRSILGVAILDSSKGVNSGFRGKIGKSPFNCVFVDVESKKMFHEVKDCKNWRKDAFLTLQFWGWPYWILPKGLTHDSRLKCRGFSLLYCFCCQIV